LKNSLNGFAFNSFAFFEKLVTLVKFSLLLASVSMLNGKATAYVCENYVCKLPTSDITVMAGLLE
jgi:uncharacterized protein YyaL (SSP411 family)